jgi:hypothetical protein
LSLLFLIKALYKCRQLSYAPLEPLLMLASRSDLSFEATCRQLCQPLVLLSVGGDVLVHTSEQ